MLRAFFAILGAVGLVAAACDSATACPSGWSKKFGIVCVPNPPNPLEAALDEATIQMAGKALENWFNTSRNGSINGSEPIPAQVKETLTGYIPEDVIDSVRYRIGDAGTFNLAAITLKYGGDVGAVTLRDVIVFKNQAFADRLDLWAHELTHVKQFRKWGVHSFAIRYIRNFHEVEDPAYAVGDNLPVWLSERPVWRLFNHLTGQHFYTANCSEAQHVRDTEGFQIEQFAFSLPTAATTYTNVFYRFRRLGDHFYTVDQNAEGDKSWEPEGDIGLVYRVRIAEFLPLLRAYNPTTHRHFWTIDSAEMSDAVSNDGFQQEGDGVGYVDPVNHSGFVCE